jgi:N-acetylglucosamine kinase-like BadF-type ATPase
VTLFGIDAGGTTTRLAVRDEAGSAFIRTYPSLNPASVADPSSSWEIALRAIAAHDGDLHGWIGSASVTKATLGAEIARLRSAADKAGATGRVVLSNDMLPLLMGPPLDGVGTAVTVGTGTSFLARNPRGDLAAASGYEFLLSDEGGAFDIGLRGLQAAGRAFDGRSRETALLRAAVELYGFDIPELGRHLAGLVRPKPEISRFAPLVCTCGETGDTVASEVLDGAVDAIVTGVAAVRRRIGTADTTILLAGGVIAGCRAIATSVKEQLTVQWSSAEVVTVPDGAESALALAVRSARLAPDAIETLSGGLPCAVVTFGGGH